MSIVKHGLSKSREHQAWRNMRARCNTPTHFAYHLYGARGIRVCPEWNDFMKFYRDLGVCPEGKSLDRIDNNLGYFKENCRWATKFEQSINRRSNRVIYFYGVKTTLGQIAKKFGINKTTLKDRINAGWDIRDAILKPSHLGGVPFQT